MNDGANHTFNNDTTNIRNYKTFTKLDTMMNAIAGIKYAFAVDSRYTINGETHENKNYFPLKTLTDVKKVLETDQHIYEIVFRKTRKLYYDFDGIDYTREEADTFIKNFITILETELNIKINPTELIVLRNENKTKSGEPTTQIQSLHIIITDYKASGDNQLKIARFINEKYDDIDIDENVYKKNQLFRMINQSKLKYGVRLVNYYEGDINIKKSLISDTLKCKAVSFDKNYTITEHFNELKDGKPLLQIPKDDIIEYILTGGNDTSIFNREEFFNNNIDWKTLTMILVKRNLYDATKWNTKSVEIANNTSYTIERNDNFITKINTFHVKSGLTKLYKIVSKYSTYNIYSNEVNVKTHTIDFLKEYYDDDTITSITEKIVNVKTTKQLTAGGKAKKSDVILHKFNTKTNDETIIDVKTGFITFNDNRSPINMFHDKLPPKSENIFEDVETILEAKEKTIEFVNSAKKIMIMKSRWGTGKTSNIINYLLETFKTHKILLITESNTLNNKLTKDFETYGFVSHIDAQNDKSVILKNHDKVICSIQSIGKISNETYDLVIIDEFESVLTSYTATTTFKSAKTTPAEAFTTLMNILKRSDKTLFTDADISEDKVSMIENVFGRDVMTIVKNNQRAFENVDINIITERTPAIELLTHKLYEEKKKVCVASASKSIIEVIIKAIQTEELENDAPPIKILKVQYEGVFIIEDGVETKYEKDTILQDVETFIIANNIQLFCYSPTIKTGVSINSSYFDITFGFASSYSVLFNEFIQMIFRARRLNDNEIVICVKENEFKNTSSNKSIEVVKVEQHLQKEFYEKLVEDSIVYLQDDVSDEYYELQSINNMNAINSKYNYAKNLLQLIQYHQLKYHYTTQASYFKQEQLISEYTLCIIGAITDLKHEHKYAWLNRPLYKYKRFTQLALKDKRERDADMTDEEIKQYDKTSLIYGLFKVKSKVNKYISQLKDTWSKEQSPFELTDEQYEQIQINIDDLLYGYNHDYFYDKYIETKKSDDVFNIHTLHHDITDLIYHYTTEDKKKIDKLAVVSLFKMLGIYDIETKLLTPKTYTNKQFKSFIIEHLDWINKCYKNKINKDIEFDVKNKLHIKTIYHHIKDILRDVDIHIIYDDANHTTRDYDTFTITNKRENITPLYNYKTFNKSSTLDHIQDKANPQTIDIDIDNIYTNGEITQRLKKTRNSKKEYTKLQISSLYNEISYEDAGKINGVYTWIRPKTIETNQHYHNELLEMKTIDEKIVLKDKTYDVICKKEDYYFVINKANNRKQKIFKYYRKNTIPYYKPYEASIPIINSKPNPYYDKLNKYANDEECCEEEYEDQLFYWEQKTPPNSVGDEQDREMWENWEADNRPKYYGGWIRLPNKDKYAKLSHHERALIVLGVSQTIKNSEYVNNLNINTPLMDEIKQTRWTMVLGY